MTTRPPGAFKHSSTFTGSETAANLNSANAKTVTVKAKWTATCSFTSKNFGYTGNVQTWTVPTGCDGYYKLEVWGAQGGDGGNGQVTSGGLGGYAYGSYKATANNTYYVVVGSKGGSDTNRCSASAINVGYGGYNGGGNSTLRGSAGGGGGATHIATRTGVLSSLSSYKSSVLIVAGGGGGGNFDTNSDGGIGGSNATGPFGQGGVGSTCSGCCGGSGGGGGWSGGAGAPNASAPGGGGSNYITTSLQNTGSSSGNRSGNGYAKITYLGTSL